MNQYFRVEVRITSASVEAAVQVYLNGRPDQRLSGYPRSCFVYPDRWRPLIQFSERVKAGVRVREPQAVRDAPRRAGYPDGVISEAE